MSSEPSIPPVIGAIAEDRTGTTLGIVAEVYRDDATGEMTWLAITDGLHSTSTTLAPASGASSHTGRVTLAVDGNSVATAPQLPQSKHLGPEQEAALRLHYSQAGAPPLQGTRQFTPTHAHPTPSPTPSPTPTPVVPELVRSEERLLISTEVVPYRRAVLRVETTVEEVLVPVSITRQHAHVEFVDIDPTTTAPVGAHLLIGGRTTGAAGEWLTLSVDEPVVSTRRVPVERVRLITDWVTGTQDVQAELDHEVITGSTSTSSGVPGPSA